MQQKNQKITIQEHLKINGLVCHSISSDCQYIAVSLKAGPSIEIYKIGELGKLSTWKLIHQLKEQAQQISSIDWFGNNTLLSTSYDRSVMVWQFRENKWKKDLVIMENSRALLCGEWSPNGKKFAVGGGDSKCFIGYFEQENDFWQTKKLESFKSSVTALSFHPSGRVVAIGSTDNTISLQTCYLEGYEDTGYNGTFSNINTFKEILISLSDTGGWIEGIAFSPSGNRFAFACHNGTVQNGYIENNDVKEQINKVNVKRLPIKRLKYADENNIVVGGYDMVPYILKYQGNEQLKYEKDLQECLSETVSSTASKIQQLQSQMFKTSQGQKTSGKHTTPILCITKLNQQGKTLISTSDMNGTLLFWEP